MCRTSPSCFVAPDEQVVADYNADPAVHGILVQLPLPPHIDETRILDAISIEKDVDGFHPTNIGMLAMRGRSPRFVSCTPKVRMAHPFRFPVTVPLRFLRLYWS